MPVAVGGEVEARALGPGHIVNHPMPALPAGEPVVKPNLRGHEDEDHNNHSLLKFLAHDHDWNEGVEHVW